MKRSRESEEEPPESTVGSLPRVPSPEAPLPVAKITGLDESAIDTTFDVAMKCSLPPHSEVLSFKTYGEYETHYNKAHTNRCLECKKNFPSEHLLTVHFEDIHDAFALVKRERGEHTYTCFVEGCDRKCRTPYKRRNHLIDKHMYPKNYFFAVTKDGIDGRRSLLADGGHHRRRSSTAATAGGAKAASRRQSLRQPETLTPETAESGDKPEQDPTPPQNEGSEVRVPEVEMEDLATKMSALQFVPTSVKFGRGKGKTGFAKR
ncbi:hypothetical protein GGR56DRAFT_626114 [Xylariaceae sp. FL0804]|nr:hypothetical protein GGR56DRAFT_626114 [Xylariaceae sp. FL0804]